MSRYCQDRASGTLYRCRYCTPDGGFCEMPPGDRCWLLLLVRQRDALLRAAREVLRVDGPVAEDDPTFARVAARDPALGVAVRSSGRALRALQAAVEGDDEPPAVPSSRRQSYDDSLPFDALPLVPGKVCSVCRGEVRHSPGGTVCEKGHGGAPLLDKEGGA